MAIKYFFLYVGSLLIISIALMVLVRQLSDNIFNGSNKPVLYGSFSAVVVSSLAFGATYISTHLFTIFWMLAGIFFLFGLVHVVYITSTKATPDVEGNKVKVFLAEVVFGFAIVLFSVVAFSSLQYFIEDSSFLFYPLLMSVLLFFVPMLTYKTYQFARDIPVPVYTTWSYPVNQPPQLPVDDLREKLLVISFLVKKDDSQKTFTHFRAKGPAAMQLGELYYFFINDYNELNSTQKIVYADVNGEPFEWLFYLEPKWFKSTTVLDPDISLSQNGVTENAVIICERTSTMSDYAA